MKRIKNSPTFEVNPNIKFSPSTRRRYARLSLVEIEGDLYLVNESSETLKTVKSELYGYLGEISLLRDDTFEYNDVLPKEGVLVSKAVSEEDLAGLGWGYYDFTRGMYITIDSKELGKIRIDPKITGKSVSEQILIDSYLNPPNGCSVCKVEEI